LEKIVIENSRESTAPMLAQSGLRQQLSRPATMAGLLWLLVMIVYLASPIPQVLDSKFTLMVGEHMLNRGNFELDEHFPPYSDDPRYAGPWVEGGLPRHIRRSGDHLYYFYPLGSVILTAPLLPVAWSLGAPHVIGKYGGYDVRAGRVAQPPLASFVTSLCVLLVFYFATLRLPVPQAFLVGLLAALSTQLWSTASRGLWSHTWLVVLLGVVCWQFLRHEVRGTPLKPVLLATLFAWCFFVRPPSAFLILAFTAYVWLRSPRDGLILSAVGAAWAGAFIAFNLSLYDSWLPPYYLKADTIQLSNLLIGIPGQWISPSRGLLVFVPLVGWLAWLGFKVRATLTSRTLVVSLLAGIAIHSLSMGSYANWWGGYSYGPRFQTDLVPVFALLAVQFVHAAAQRVGRSIHRPLMRSECILLVLAAVIGALFNGAGAWSQAAVDWNRFPQSLREQPMRAFELQHSQFMVALFPSLLEAEAPPSP
jgi:hypothetical protein